MTAAVRGDLDRSGHDLELLLRSRVPLILIETHDERRACQLIAALALRVQRPAFSWSLTQGLTRLDLQGGHPMAGSREPERALAQITLSRSPGIYVLLDFHPHVEDPARVRQLKEIALDYAGVGHTLVFVSHAFELPGELAPYAARFELSLPDRDTLRAWVNEEAGSWSASRGGRRVRGDERILERLLDRLEGLTEADARRLIRNAIVDDGAITETDLAPVMQAKYQLLGQGGALSFELETARFGEVGGLQRLKRWLLQRRETFLNPDGVLPPPRGLLLVGVQGGGKSLAAKAIAGLWALPLLRFDVGALYNKFFGETERNLREALRTAEAMAPCVLWIDEIEKAISAGEHDSGTSQRVLGTLLTWMAERRSAVFLVATANRIEALPPELIRKGRLDEIFFVDLPGAEIRAEIFRIHLERRGQDPAAFNLQALAGATEGYSGAEIEQAVVAALYLARELDAPLDGAMILTEVRRTRPLSVVMAEPLARLRHWAAERTVPAH